MLSALATAVVLAPFSFYEHAPYERAVPRPESILGYGPGERHTVFRDQEEVVLKVAGATPTRVRVFQYGKSVQGRPLRVLAISSEENIRRLEAIRQDAARLANPAEGADLGPVLARMPAIVWINQCIHGDETASFESAMWLLYNLASSNHPRIQKMREEAVVVLNPVYNPDGHERYVVWYNSIPNGSPRPEAFEHAGRISGRGNQYRFDMNRDRVILAQDESRQEVAEFLKWNPQVYVDQHGQTSNYFFPPNPMAVNANVDRGRLEKWTDIFGRATARAFDKNGWLYFIRQDFDFYYAGYLDTWAGLTGAIGMTHETDGGRVLARERNDGSILTLRDGIEKHFTSALAVIEAAGERRRDLLTSYVAFKRKAVTGEHAGKMRQVVVPPHQPGWDELATVLGRHGIRVAYAAASYRQTMTDYWSGETKLVEVPAASMIIDLAQPQGPLAKALLERGSDFEPEFIKQQLRKREERRKEEKYPAPDDFDFYDMTGWSLIYLFGMNAYHSEELAPIIVAGAEIAREVPPSLVDEGTGWAHFPSDDRAMVKLAELLRQDVRAAVITRASSAGSMNLPPGTVMVLRGRNDPDAFEKVRRSGLPFVNVSTAYPGSGADGPGSWSVRPLARPEIGIVFGSGGLNADFPYAWYVFDRVFKMPYTPLATGALSGDLSRYSCILVPSNLGSIPDRLREWVRQGGCLVVLGNPQWAVGDGRLVSLEQVKQDPAPMSVPGAIFRARLDQRSFLSWGVGRSEIAVPVDGSRFYRAKKEGGSVVTFDADENTTKLLSGWVWPDETEKLLAGAVWLHEEPVGRGRVVVFTQDPLDRAMWPGLHRLLLNAMLFGPGL